MVRAGILFAAAALGGCSDMCANTLVSRVTAPGGEHDAVLFRRDCGATSAYSTQVSVVAAGEMPTGGGNAFVADDDHGRIEVAAWEAPWAEVTWLSEDRLRIRYAAGARIFEQDGRVSGVGVTYEPVAQ